MSAGKGDKLRKGANLKAYRENYDLIFKNKKAKSELIEDPSPKSVITENAPKRE